MYYHFYKILQEALKKKKVNESVLYVNTNIKKK